MFQSMQIFAEVFFKFIFLVEKLREKAFSID